MHLRFRQTFIGVLCLATLLVCLPLRAGEVAKADLDILGLALEVDRNPVTTAVDIPAYVQTKFGGKSGSDAPPAPGMSAMGELTGPGIDAPITLATAPGQPFALPALHEKGEYALQNIRLVGAAGEFLQQAIPSFAIINVTDVLKTEVRVRQLTPEELRERGIQVDARNYDVYEYTFVFGVDTSQTVTIPYPVIVDKRTHEVVPAPRESPYTIPAIPQTQRPPRFEIPDVSPFELGVGSDPGGNDPPDRENSVRPSIPAALVVPNGFGVLHQFFAVVLQVQNSSPDANIRLDSITATINAPSQLRVAKVLPAVSIGQPVPINDEKTGATYLVAAARGSAEWSLEALKAGTHTVDVEVRATFQKPGQPDVPMRGRVSTSLVVSDPRFQINFSHPDTVRKDEKYTAWAFVTNLSSQSQHIVLDSVQVPLCTSGAAVENICRQEGEGTIALDLEPGQMKPVPYKMLAKLTGKVFAAAGATTDEALGASVKLTMGVSASGLPLSPATLVMPYYAQFLPGAFVDANMQLLGLAYGLATAPLNVYTAKFPRVLKQDVFTRAQQIARAGQRIFIARTETREPFFHLALDLLGNSERVDQIDTMPELREWDELRRAEESGRRAEAAMARELEANGFSVDAFAAATSHRAPFLFAYAHGAAVNGATRPYALSVKTLTSGGVLDVPAEGESGWIRTLPYSQLTKLNDGELALVGRWRDEDFRIRVVPAASAFTLHLIYPDTANGTQLRTDIDVTNAVPGVAVEIDVRRGARTLIVKNATATPLVNVVPQTALRVVGAAQDLHLDEAGHLVSLLFNRPVKVSDAKTLRDRFALTVNVAKANYSVTRRNTPSDPNAQLQIPGAALQDDAKIINVTFDKTLSRNAAYLIGVDSVTDLVTASSFSKSDVVPRIDNDRPGAILTGKVLRADNTPVANVLVNLLSNQVRQLDLSGADGRYLFEFVPRDLDSGIAGGYALSATDGAKTASLDGAVRLAGEVHNVNLLFLGRGRAIGNVRYSDGELVPGIEVTIGSTMFDQARHGVTDAQGNYDIGDLPVGPLTFSVVDKEGRPTFAANQIRTAGEVVTQDLVIVKRDPPGSGTVRITVRRSDTNAVIAGALVGVWQQGYALRDGYTGTDGTFTFADVPAGVVSMLAADFSLSRNGAGVEVELRRDQTLEQTLVISVPLPSVQYATLEGTVLRDDPAAPGDTTKDQLVPGAIVTVSRVPAVTANADGIYAVPDLPLDAAGRTITVFDPTTGRRGYFTMPTLVAGSNHFTLRLRSTEPAGLATARVRLYGPQNESVSGYRVIWPGFPPDEFAAKGSGVYELANVRVPQTINVAAVPANASGPYGEQVAFGSVRVDFHGQIGVSDLRLPGSGTVIVRLELEGSSAQAIGPVALTYGVWDEAEQSMSSRTIEGTPDPNSGLVTFTNVPARQDFTVATVRNPAGFAAAIGQLAYDHDVRNITLRLKTIGDVSGRVYAFDGVTPVSGATVRIFSRNATYAPAITAPDGTFRFAGIAAATDFTLVADLDRDGVYRTGIAGGRTPQGGGPVANLVIQMRQQSAVEGRVIDTNDAVVPLARFWLRELAWPYRSIGTPQEPLQADIHGRFVVSNVFTGEFRITAVHPTNQDLRGDYQGSLAEEGDASQRNVEVRIGGAGVGSVSVTVTDPLLGFAPAANAEVALYRGSSRFDFATANENGVVFFDSVPVGTYSVGAYSKTVGRGGGSGSFSVASQQTTSVTVQLEFRGLVSGTLTDPESEPTAGLPVKGTPVHLQSQSSTQAASTDVLGAFEFLGVPEGAFSLTAFEIGTNRRAYGPSNLFISRLVPERKNIQLELERTGTLTIRTYLPNDGGGAGELAPLTEVTVWQGNLNYGPLVYYRGQQGNPVTFRKLLRGRDYGVEVRELGGEGRVVRSGGHFSTSNLTQEQSIIFPTSGSVEVRVVDASNQPVADARVDIFAANGTRTMYTPASGIVTLPGVPFGWVTAQVSKGNVTASGGGSLASRSQTLVIPLNLGANAAVEGGVDAELGIGQPSVHTRVLMTVSTRLLQSPLRLETLTDANGAYRFTGIPVGGTTLSLTFYGPDDTSIGATRTVPVADGTTGVIAIPRVKIDATPPRVLSIDPPANATSVSPSSVITITFSEQVASAYLNRDWFSLLATDDGSFVNSSIEPSVRPDGTFIVRIVPPPPPAGQKFALKSNVLYRLAIPAGIRDTTGNAMPVAIGSSFTTVNYTEPAVVKIDPPENLPIAANTTFRIKFNKAIDLTGGVVTLERLDAYKGNAMVTIAIAKYLDPADASTLVVAPQGVAIAESSFYRLTVSDTRDTQTPPNVQKDPRVFEFASFDTRKPVAKIVSPLAEGESLVSELLYTASVSVKDEVTNEESSDVAYVDWLDANGVAISRVKTKPYGYSFVAPATTTGTTFTLKASAVDLSGNASPTPDTFTWNVAPNLAPRDITVTNTPPSAYPTHSVQTRVRLKDEGLVVNVSLELRGVKTDGTEYRQVLGSTNLSRATTGVEFGEAVFNYTLSETLKDGTATVVATATDSVNKTAVAEAPLTILADTTKPEIVAFTPKAETHYQFNQTYTVQLQVKDAETGIARAVISVNGVEVLNATAGSYDAASGVTTFTKGILVPPKNADTRIAIVATAYDRRNNAISETHEVIYDRRDDSTLPKAAWLTPLDGAALPANQPNWQATLRIRATDDSKVTSVRFESAALAAPITIENPKSGTTDVFEAKVTLAMPADKSPFVIKAIVADGDPAHDVELPITIDPVDVAPAVTADINISSITADQYANKSVFVRGARVYISVPLVLKDLILVDGALLSNPEETKLDVTIADHLFLDADSRIDVSARGYLGGYRTREDSSFTNPSIVGRTLGGTTNGGASGADGSHGGIGGSGLGVTNATYGSITAPTDFGSGGTGAGTGEGGGNGGGAVALRRGAGLARFVLAGPVRADGEKLMGAGAGGSILIDARAIITGPLTHITANGADETSLDYTDLGGGGGRIAVRASERLDVDPAAAVIQAHGGRNGNAEGATYVDGGAGTIHLIRPGATLGELIVSSFDDRYPSSTHRSGATPLAGALNFDTITIGPRALARFDTTTATPMTVDPTATVVTPADLPSIAIGSTTPAAGGDVAQNTAVSAQFNAASASGIREVRAILSAQPNDVVSYPKWPLSLSGGAITIAIPSSAAPVTATLKLRVTDRAGRVAETAPVSFNIINNAAPVIQTFDVTPAELYANHSISVSASASDDVGVNSLTLASSAGTVTSGTATKPTPTTMARTFTVAIPANAASNSDVTLTLSAIDDIPGRVPTTASKTVHILKDTVAPSIAIVKPAPAQQFDEGTGNTFTVEANVADAEVAVKRVSVTFEGTEYDLALVSGTLYRKVLSVPNVDGSEPVAKTLTISAVDYNNNTAASDVTIAIKPLLDPNAPQLSWSCASPGAMYPPGYEVVLRAYAVPSSGSNGVSSVTFTIDGAPGTIASSAVGTNLYEAKYTIPAATPDGTLLNVRANARSVSGNESSLLGTILVVANAIEISTQSNVGALDPGYQNRNVVVRSGGQLTLIGEQHLKNLVVLSGGTLVQKHPDLDHASTVSVERLFVACGGAIDVSALGYARVTTYPGAGVPDDASSGSHMGRGAHYTRVAGLAFGSVYEPLQAGGGAHVYESGEGAGGGVVRIVGATSVAIEGLVRANGAGSSFGGSGAGGSIWISSRGHFAGNGTYEAIGGAAYYSGGGGGAITLDYASSSGTPSMTARGGTGGDGRNGGAGTTLRRALGKNGDFTIDNGSVSLYSHSQLPWFGRATAGAVSGSRVTLGDRRWISPALAGHRVRVIAPDGTVRGTYRLAGVVNPMAYAQNFFYELLTTDAAAYDGYLMWSKDGLGAEKRPFAAVRKNGAQWQYDNDSAFVNFTPTATDFLFASFSKSASGITRLDLLRCAAACGSVDGLPIAEVVQGDVAPDVYSWRHPRGFDSGLTDPNPSEILLHTDGVRNGFVVSAAFANITLESLDGGAVSVQPGDTLRGIYQFDSAKFNNAGVSTEDLVEVATPPQILGSAWFVGGNETVPVVKPALISIQRGLRGAVVAGAAGAITDPDAPLDVIARNANSSVPPQQPIVLRMTNYAGSSTVGGFSIYHIDNYRPGSGAASALTPITTAGYLAFTPSLTRDVQVGLAPADTTYTYAEPGHNSFRLRSGGSYEVWVNGAYANKSGSYTTATNFRIEKRTSSLQFYVDNVLVHSVTSGVPASLLLDVSYDVGAWNEITGVEYVTNALAPPSMHGSVAADGSFRLPISGLPGDPITIRARDRHAFPVDSKDLVIGTLPNDIGVASLTLASNELTGGRTTTGTVTLLATAGSEGALVELTTNNAAASAPASITIPAGAMSGTFPVTTFAVSTPTDVTITASYGLVAASAVLRVVKDNIAPSVTIAAPAANAQYTEGQAAKIAVQVTATDADSGVKRVFATIDGTSYDLARDMAKGADVYTGQVPVPFVDGSQPVTRDLVVTAEDNTGNLGASSAVPLVINAVVDANPPAVAWSCGSSAIYPVEQIAKFRVIAKAPNAANVLHKVELTVGTATIPMTSLGNDVYEATYSIPDAADGTLFTTRVVATTASATTAQVTGTLTILKGAIEIKSSTAIASNDTSKDNKSIVVFDGATLTVSGKHTFTRLVVLPSATVTHTSGSQLDVEAGSIFVACGGAIDASGLAPSSSTFGKGGSHLGRGWNNGAGTTYGSVVQPQESGVSVTRSNGGGIVRLAATTSIAVDGVIRANALDNTLGSSNEAGGSAGSIWITTARLGGGGTIEANGGSAQSHGGGGGAIAIEYTDAASSVPALVAHGGYGGTSSSGRTCGGPGTKYVKGPQSTYGDLAIDGPNDCIAGVTELPGLGSGIAQPGSAGNTLVTDRAADIPTWFAGYRVRVTTAAGVVKGTWRILSVSAKSVVLAPNGGETISIAAGDRWLGLYLFDNAAISNTEYYSTDRIESTARSVSGSVTTDVIDTASLTVAAGAVLRPWMGSALTVRATDNVVVDGAIDASERGASSSSIGFNRGGSHLGRGGNISDDAATFGSVERPQEIGIASAARGASGGVLRITAHALAVNGAIRANGQTNTLSTAQESGGAGGSIWITTAKISGGGTIEAEGGGAYSNGGGGGAIAIETGDAASTLPPRFARGGSAGNAGGAGTQFTKGPQSTYGDLTVEGISAGAVTQLPSLGNGVALPGSGGVTLITDRASDVPSYFAGHWIEIANASGVKGTWRVATINLRTVTLAPNGAETIDVQPGDSWYGVYRFDTLKLRTAALRSADRVTYATLDKDAASTITANSAAPSFPEAKRAQIVVVSATAGDSITAPAGAVSDSDTPVKLVATNTRTGASTPPVNAAADGSFTIPLSAAPGDTFTLRATDSHAYPLWSVVIPVSGAVVETNGVASLAIAPGAISAGGSATGTIQLLLPARAAGTVVALASNNALAVVPASITVPGGATSAQFTITSPASSSGAAATITASCGTTSKGASLDVLPSGTYFTTVTGRVVDERARTISGLAVTCASRTATSQSNGTFSIAEIPVAGAITCSASQTLGDGSTISGSASANPVANGTTNVGDVVLRLSVTGTQLNASAWGVDSAFRARTLAREGRTLIVTGAGGGTGTGDSDRFVQLDLTNPASPAFVRTISGGNTAIYDVELSNGWAYVASYDFCTVNIASTTSSKNCFGTVGALTVAVVNQYAFVATNTSYNIRVYDMTNPASARFLREQAMIPNTGFGHHFWDLINLGNGYLAAASFTSENSVGHDLVILDVRDVNSFAKVVDLDIPNFQSVRGRVEGSTLYLSSSSGEVAAIDVSTPTSPVILSRTALAGGGDNAFPVGNDLLAAAGTAGLAQLDVTSPATPFLIRNITTSGVARDVIAYANYAYVANDNGLAIMRLPLAPQIDKSRIALARQTPNVTITGGATAITGDSPITVTVTNVSSGAVAPGFSVAGDGSFTASIAAAAGDRIAVTAFDAAGRSTKRFDVGTVPFGTSVAFNYLNPTIEYRARAIRTDGTYLVVAKFAGEESGTNTQIAVFDISGDPASPLYKYFINGATEGSAYGFDVRDGWGFMGGWDFCTIDLRNAFSSRHCVGLNFSDNTAVVSGNFVFTAVNWQSNDGRIRVYDVTNPASPFLRREQVMLGAGGGEFHDLKLLGTQYLVAVSPNGHDVVVIDRSNIDSLVKIADIDIPNFAPFRSHLEGNVLYLSDWAGDKVAVVDLATPTSPVVRSVLATGAPNHGITGYPNRIILAGSMLGAVYVDTTTPANPKPLGMQFTSGNAWDVLYRNGVLYVANEQGLTVIPNANP